MSRSQISPSFMLQIHAEPNSMQAVFLRRAISALERISGSVSLKTLTEALAAPTDTGSLAQLLSRSDNVGTAVTELEPLVPAFARNVAHRQTLIQLAGGAFSAEEAGRTLSITRQAVDKRRRANNLLAIREGSDWRYPVCQFDQGNVIAGIADIVQGFAQAGPWVALDFLLAPDSTLADRTPLQALKQGDREEVRRLVSASLADGFA